MGKLPVVKGHAEVVKSLYQMRGQDDTTIQRGIVQGKRRPDNNLCQSQALGILHMVLAVSTFMRPEDSVIMLLEDRRNRAVTSETLKHSHEIIV